jgi:hypothetical protein
MLSTSEDPSVHKVIHRHIHRAPDCANLQFPWSGSSLLLSKCFVFVLISSGGDLRKSVRTM